MVFNGAGLGTLGAFAFPLGNLIESVCWLISLLVRLRAERIQSQRRLLHEATHDALTGLPNRVCLTADSRSSLAACGAGPRPARCTGLVLLDLDRFKAINFSLGYAIGDEVLVAVAGLLRSAAPAAATVAHLGADTFALLLHGQPPCSAQAVAWRISALLREPLSYHSGTVNLRASMSVVNTPAPDSEVIEVLRDADSALNLAKVGGGNRSVNFQPD